MKKKEYTKPEFSQGVLNSGIDRFTYPFSRSYTVGAQVSF